MTDVVISGMKYRAIEKMAISQLEHMAGLCNEAIVEFTKLTASHRVGKIRYNGRTYLEQLNEAVVIINETLKKREAK